MHILYQVNRKIVNTLFAISLLVAVLAGAQNTAYATSVGCGNASESTSVTFFINESGSRNIYDISVNASAPKGTFKCPTPPLFEAQLINVNTGAVVQTESISSPLQESNGTCSLLNNDTFSFTLPNTGDYTFKLVQTNGDDFISSNFYCTVSGYTFDGGGRKCGDSGTICQTGATAGCAQDDEICTEDPDGGFECLSTSLAGEYAIARNRCELVDITCGASRECQTGHFGGCESDNQICIFTGGASSHACVDISDERVTAECGEEAQCIAAGGECTPGGTTCCNDRACVATEGSSTGYGCYQESLDAFGTQGRGRLCPTCDDDYGGPDALLSILYRISIPAAVILGLFMIVTCGYKVMTTHGDPRHLQDAQECITSAIIGLLFIMLSVSILRLVISSILTEI